MIFIFFGSDRSHLLLKWVSPKKKKNTPIVYITFDWMLIQLNDFEFLYFKSSLDLLFAWNIQKNKIEKTTFMLCSPIQSTLNYYVLLQRDRECVCSSFFFFIVYLPTIELEPKLNKEKCFCKMYCNQNVPSIFTFVIVKYQFRPFFTPYILCVLLDDENNNNNNNNNKKYY